MNASSSKATQDAFEINRSPLFCGVTGLVLPVDLFELTTGIILRKTYAHIIAPFLMAFKQPEHPGQHHQGPLKVLQPGGFDVLTEVELSGEADTLGFDRLNAVWFSVAMLRLKVGQPFQAAVIADRPYSSIPAATDAAHIRPVELNRNLLATSPWREVTIEDLDWVRQHLRVAAALMKHTEFNRAFQTIDSATLVNNPGAGIVIAWAAIETLVRPGSFDITKRLAKALATFLYSPGPGRDKAYSGIEASYAARGGAVHAGRVPDQEQFHSAFDLARSALRTAIENAALPDIEDLLERWKSRT